MKKILALALALVVLTFSNLWAAGSCTQHIDKSANTTTVDLVCKGDSSDGSIPNTALTDDIMKQIKGKLLYVVEAFPGGTAPDAADVFILDKDSGKDLLGSADMATAGKGANLIHATLGKEAFPYSYTMSASYMAPIGNGLTLKVANQATASAIYTIRLKIEE